MVSYRCNACGKKSPSKKCRSCGSLDMMFHKPHDHPSKKAPETPINPAPDSVINSSNTPKIDILPPIESITPEPGQNIYAEIEKTVNNTALVDKAGMDIKSKCDLVFGAPFIVTNFICDQIDKDSKFKPLAEIWHFDEKEIDEIVNYIFSIFEQYWPNVLEKISKIDVMFIIFNGLAIFMIFGKKIIATIKFFKEQENIKKEMLKNDTIGHAQPAPGN
jgi:hypothetical protein